MLQKKSILLSVAVAGTLFIGCSENPGDVNGPDGGSTLPIDTLSTVPYTNPETGETYPVYVNPETGEMTPVSATSSAAIPVSSGTLPNISSSTIVPGSSMAFPGSSALNPKSSSSSKNKDQSSSSGLKEYDDNHKAKETFLPKAGFYKNLTIEPPTPQKGGQIKCTFDGSIPTQGSQSITSAMAITKNTVVRCSEFVNGQPADTTTQTYFINENVSMPVVAITVNHTDMFDSTTGLYATGPLNGQGGQGQWGGMVELIGRMATPVCMLILGMRLALMRWKPMFTRPIQYLAIGLKMIVFPLAALLVCRLLPVERDFVRSVYILCCVPVASVVLSFSEMLGEGQDTAANVMLLSTLLSLALIPLMMQLPI